MALSYLEEAHRDHPPLIRMRRTVRALKQSRKGDGLSAKIRLMRLEFFSVRKVGLEPTRISAQEPKSCVSTVSPLPRAEAVYFGEAEGRTSAVCENLEG